MKKITLVAISIFVVLVSSIKVLSIVYPATPSTQIQINTSLSQPNSLSPAVTSVPVRAGTPNPKSAVIGQQIQPTQATTVPKSSFSMAEVSQHNSTKDCYLVIQNTVYDVSSYLGSHPGGRGVIQSRCGTEVTGIFAQIHSNRAWNLLGRYKVGVIN